MPTDPGLAIDHLPDDCRRVAQVVLDTLLEKQHKYGEPVVGCQAFFSAEQWAEREGLPVDHRCLLHVVNAGTLAQYFSYDCEEYESLERLQFNLAAHGWFAEQQTCWFSNIYKI